MNALRAAAILLVIHVASTACATWSIIIVDTRSKEVVIGSATCLIGFNLRTGLPVVRVDVGAAAAQSAIDSSGANRKSIWAEFTKGTHPDAILARLQETDANFQSRQYGIVDVRGRAITFTGSGDGRFANGKTGRFGDLIYSIQGNVITGQAVIDHAENAILTTPGALPEKLMAAMEAARSMGGDGRCSCPAGAPDSCGSPPAEFTKAAHVGFMLGTRRGDLDGICDAGNGCANGNYYMHFNITHGGAVDPDPVLQLTDRFNEWRLSLVGVTDAVESIATLTPDHLPNNGTSQSVMMIELRDWQTSPVTDAVTVQVTHDANSAGSCTIGTPIGQGNGVYSVPITAGTIVGTDIFTVSVQDAGRTKFLIPSPKLTVDAGRHGQGSAPPVRRPWP